MRMATVVARGLAGFLYSSIAIFLISATISIRLESVFSFSITTYRLNNICLK